MEHNSDDGRVLRRVATRARLVDAHARLLRAGEAAPTAAQIAHEAGVSVRSLWGAFGDMESLLEATSAHWAAEDDALAATIEPTWSLPDRVQAFCAERQRRLEYIAPAARAVSVRLPYSQALQRYRARSYEQLRMLAGDAFAPEIARADAGLRDRIVVAASWNSWAAYRDDLGYSAEGTRTQLERTIWSLVGEDAVMEGGR